MKTIKDIEEECELETKGKTFDEKQAYKLGVFKTHYEIATEIIEMKNNLIIDLAKEIIKKNECAKKFIDKFNY
jgi:hypothetical protein